MKLKLILALGFSSVVANGAVISATNLLGPGGYAITDNSGEPIAPVVAILTTFNGNAAPTTVDELVASSFNNLGQNGVDDEGGFSSNYSGAGGTGESIFVIFADNADLSLATYVGLVDTQQTLDPDGASPDANTFLFGEPTSGGSSYTALIGEFSATPTSVFQPNAGGDITVAGRYSLVETQVIPEPSAALLAGLALVGGLVRRRR